MLRHGLRKLALPAGIEELLLATSGSPSRLATLAERLELPADEVLQAARFFVQELLLHPDADAYRVLGVAVDADQAVIKRHHRALQHWLHPDRLSNSPESVYSARVNHAWDRLRTPARRAAFDASAARAPHVDHGSNTPVKVHVQRWERTGHVVGPSSGPQLLATFLLFVICVGLLWLALRESPVPTLPERPGLAQAAVERVESLVAMLDGVHDAPEPASEEPTAAVPPPDLPVLIPVQGAHIAAAERSAADDDQPRSNVLSPVERTFAPPVAPTVEKRTFKTAPPKEVSIGAPVAMTPSAEQNVDRPAVTSRAERAEAGSTALLERHRAAQEQAGRLLTYLTRRNAQAPPIWRNVTALESAEAIRSELTGGATFRRAKADIGQARWSMGEATAALIVPIQPADRNAAPRSVQASLVWHDNTWWVDTVSMGPPQ